MQRIRSRLGFVGMITVDPIGKSGGLALLWKDDNEMVIQNYSCVTLVQRSHWRGLTPLGS